MTTTTTNRPVYWMGQISAFDDFGKLINDEFVNGKTQMGPWAVMTPDSWIQHGVGILGVGLGQRYRFEAGKWLKVEG